MSAEKDAIKEGNGDERCSTMDGERDDKEEEEMVVDMLEMTSELERILDLQVCAPRIIT